MSGRIPDAQDEPGGTSAGDCAAPDCTSAQLRRDNWELRCRLAETRHALSSARAELDVMLHSRSWRLTEFLRRGAESMRRLRGTDAIAKAKASRLRSLASFAPAPDLHGRPLLLVDVTELAITNLQGGIQHTVKGILSEWLLDPPGRFRVVPVQLTAEGVYVSASGDLAHVFGDLDTSFAGKRITFRAGDVFVGLDLLRDHAQAFREGLQDLKRHGVHVQIVVYDLLPVDLPHCVPEWIGAAFSRWLDVVAEQADGVSAISNTVALRFKRWMSERGSSRAIDADSFRLGAPKVRSERTTPAVRQGQRAAAPAFLMVGTLEPRKGYDVALAALERLWAAGTPATLTIVGRYGWGVPELARQIESHLQFGRRLYWVRQATDDDVDACYAQSDALIFSSYGEGFGLPIVEAAQHGLPMILRDLPEFREVAGDGAYYFSGSAEELAAALEEWLALASSGGAPCPDERIAISWQESAAQLFHTVESAVTAAVTSAGPLRGTA